MFHPEGFVVLRKLCLFALLRLLGEDARQARRRLLEEHEERRAQLVLAGDLREGLDDLGVHDGAVVVGALDGRAPVGPFDELHDRLGDGRRLARARHDRGRTSPSRRRPWRGTSSSPPGGASRTRADRRGARPS